MITTLDAYMTKSANANSIASVIGSTCANTRGRYALVHTWYTRNNTSNTAMSNNSRKALPHCVVKRLPNDLRCSHTMYTAVTDTAPKSIASILKAPGMSASRKRRILFDSESATSIARIPAQISFSIT